MDIYRLYELIPKDHYITRAELCALSGLPDRTVRKMINELRKHPETIVVSSSHGKGYKRPLNIEELEMCLYESRSRVKDEMEKQRVLEKAIQKMKFEKGEIQLYLDFSA